MWNGVGWGASGILVATIVFQVVRQWRTGHSEGVSRLLFIGEILASSGFVAYSAHVGDPVFVATNIVLLVANIVGLAIVIWHRSGAASRQSAADGSSSG